MVASGCPERDKVPVVTVEREPALSGRVDCDRPIPVLQVDDLPVRRDDDLRKRVPGKSTVVHGEEVSSGGRRARIEDPREGPDPPQGMDKAGRVQTAPRPTRPIGSEAPGEKIACLA